MAVSDQSAPAPLARRTIFAGAIGNALEWYDFAIYGYFAPVIAAHFFPTGDPATALVATFGVFAGGFLMRPVGGLVIGHLGDSLGRRVALMVSVGLMAIPTALIAILPGYASFGLAAPVLLTLLRLLQGLSVGGEYTGSIAFLYENAAPRRRGLVTSIALTSAVAGILLGSATGAIVDGLLTTAQVDAWGWRLPFAFGLALALFAIVLRRGMAGSVDTLVHEAEEPPPLPIVEAVRKHWRGMLQVTGINLGLGAAFYIMFVYLTTFLWKVVGEGQDVALEINTASLAVLALSVPLFAWISDRVGRRPLLIAGAVVMLLGTWPLFWVIHHPDPLLSLAGQLAFAFLFAIFVGPIPATMCALFPHRVRCSAVSVAYNLPLALFGGTAPMVAAWLIARTGADLSPASYLTACAAISLAAVLTLKKGAVEEQGAA